MTTLLDASAVLAFFADEPAADEVVALLDRPDDPSLVTAVNLAEVIDRLVRIGKWALVDALNQVAGLRAHGLGVVEVDAFDGLVAGAFRAHYYDRAARALSLADCIALAATMRHDCRLATTDPALASTAHDAGLTVIPLPNSRGVRPVVDE